MFLHTMTAFAAYDKGEKSEFRNTQRRLKLFFQVWNQDNQVVVQIRRYI